MRSRVAILGFGTVGQSVARLLLERHADRLEITHIANRGVDRKRAAWVPAGVTWTDDLDEAVGADVDIVVELIGGLSPARDHVTRALAAGKSVVTANKQLVARHGAELMALAMQCGGHLRFEGSVAGGVPVLRAIEDGLAADRLVRVAGVVNGTSTFILSRMEDGDSFASALAEARVLGYAEADPSDDLTGRDASAKLAILSATALGRTICPSEITCRSIESIEPVDLRYAGELGCTIRQVAWAEAGDPSDPVVAAVRPALVSKRSPLSRVTGSQNVVTVQGEFGGETAFFGRGAGGDATAVAVVSDVLAIAEAMPLWAGTSAGPYDSGVPRNLLGGSARSGRPSGSLRRAFVDAPSRVTADYSAPHYVRFTVSDRPGIIAKVSEAFARQGVSINAVLQHPGMPSDRLPFVMTLERCSETRMDAAMAEIAPLEFHVQPPVVLPVFEGVS